MQSAACPRCAEPVRVPDSDASATVRCPWCRESFELSEVIARLPPLLEVIPPDYAATDDGGPTAFSGAEDYSLAVDGEPSGGERAAAGSAAAGAFAPGAFNDGSLRPGPPRRSRPGSPVKSVAKIAAGGIAGILIALVILQFMGRLPDLGFWPFRGPGTPIFAANHRFTGQSDRASAIASPVREPQPTSGRTPLSPAPNAPAPNAAAPDATAPDAATKEADAAEETDAEATESSPVELPLPDFENSPQAPASPLQQAISDARESLDRYNKLEDEPSVAPADRLRPLLDSLAALGRHLSDASTDVAPEREELDSLVDAMAADRGLLKQLLAASVKRLGNAAEESEAEQEAAEQERAGQGAAEETGALAIGQLSVDGSEYHLKKSAADPDPLKMLVNDSIGVDVPTDGSVVLVLGRLVRSSAETAVRAGYIRSLAPRK